ncbi:hypothetical protein M407DRAFT_13046 [Tulasnella calospora MUT 4182]|uniref:Uncharacterized protein n=1 Tax=Tulasnella calospora MUT 4182 TaxID=1051891 RepID=A0A0C3PNH6_9AGAM|nr:hypothetical protein M407DRAFT_13046 [Tulasnella calospora MUT 4182]
MDEVAEIGYPLTLTNTLQTPPGIDPGLKYPLKRSDSAEDCFVKFHPYLLWLREFIHLNPWVPVEITNEYDTLWKDYKDKESECDKISAVKEFFSQTAHSKVLQLWNVYKRLRKRVDDMGSKRVTKKQNQIATRVIAELLRSEEENKKSGTG